MEVADTDPLIVNITKTRKSVHTDHLLEYRLEVNPVHLNRLTAAGITGRHPEPESQATPSQPSGSQPPAKKPASPDDKILYWIPASIMRQVHPRLVEIFDARQAAKVTKTPRARANKGKRRAGPGDTEDEDDEDEDPEEMPSSPMKRATQTGNSQPRPTADPPKPAPAPVLLQQGAVPALTPGPSKPRKPSAEPSASVSQPSKPRPATRTPPARPQESKPERKPVIPVFPRVFYNVGLIESEEPPDDNCFLFTYTDPDDPDYLIDEDEAMGPNDPVDIVEIDDDPPPRMHMSQLVPPPPAPPSPVTMPQTQPEVLAARRSRPITSSRPAPAAGPSRQASQQGETDIADEWENFADAAHPGGPLTRYDPLFDQILGITPGATRRTKATKRSRALGLADADEQSGSQPAKKRKTPASNPSAASSPPPLPPSQPPATNVPAPTQHIAAYSAITPFDIPAPASGSQPQPRPHPRPKENRDADIVILDDSDDERPTPYTKTAKAGAAPPTWQSQAAMSSQESRLNFDGFLAGIDRFARLS